MVLVKNGPVHPGMNDVAPSKKENAVSKPKLPTQ